MPSFVRICPQRPEERTMQLRGIHHITAITADAQQNLDFYAGLLGLRFVKKTVNFDDPTAYHLYYGDERGSPGSILTFFEYPGVARGRAGRGMIHRLIWRVADEAALDFWERRLQDAALETERGLGSLRFRDPEGLALELRVAGVEEAPLAAEAAEVPSQQALLGFEGVRAYTGAAARSAPQLRETLGFASIVAAGPEALAPTTESAAEQSSWRVEGEGRSSTYAYDPAPPTQAVQGAGTVHHIAWAVADDEQEAWRRRVVEAGLHATPIIDRTYFRSVYFREPSGVLFEIATLSPGFAVDEPWDELGRSLKLPPQHEYLRPRLEQLLTPLHLPERKMAA
jgi:glyoxalase family protein